MSAVPRNTWIELLEVSCSQVSVTCLDIIIDQAGSDSPLLPSVLSVEPALPWYSLFTGLPEAGADELAPLLVRVDLAQPLQRQWLVGLVQALNGRSQLLVLGSLWPFQALAEHLGRCLEVRNGGYLGCCVITTRGCSRCCLAMCLNPSNSNRCYAPRFSGAGWIATALPNGLRVRPIRPSCRRILPLSN